MEFLTESEKEATAAERKVQSYLERAQEMVVISCIGTGDAETEKLIDFLRKHGYRFAIVVDQRSAVAAPEDSGQRIVRGHSRLNSDALRSGGKLFHENWPEVRQSHERLRPHDRVIIPHTLMSTADDVNRMLRKIGQILACQIG